MEAGEIGRGGSEKARKREEIAAEARRQVSNRQAERGRVGVSLPSADTATKRPVYGVEGKKSTTAGGPVVVEAAEGSLTSDKIENVYEDSLSALSDEGLPEDGADTGCEDDDDGWDSEELG